MSGKRLYAQGTLRKLCGIGPADEMLDYYVIRKDGLWFQPPAGFDCLTLAEQEGLSGFQELEPIKTEEGLLLGLSTAEGVRPLLPFPFTAQQLWQFNHASGHQLSSRVLRFGDVEGMSVHDAMVYETERWLAEQPAHIEELGLVLISGEEPPPDIDECIANKPSAVPPMPEDANIADKVLNALGQATKALNQTAHGLSRPVELKLEPLISVLEKNVETIREQADEIAKAASRPIEIHQQVHVGVGAAVIAQQAEAADTGLVEPDDECLSASTAAESNKHSEVHTKNDEREASRTALEVVAAESSNASASTRHIDEYKARGPEDRNKPWPQGLTDEVAAHRLKHGLKKTAEHLGISQAAVGKHLAKIPKKPITTTAQSSVFHR